MILARALAALLLSASAQAPAGADPVFSALEDELRRSTSRLDMDGLGKPYYMAYNVHEIAALEASAAFGALLDSHLSRARYLKVRLRVGSPGFDNSHYVSRDFWAYRPVDSDLTVEDDYVALRVAAWAATDEAYKNALQRFSQKKAYRKSRMIRDQLGDLSPEPAISVRGAPGPREIDRPGWESALRRASSVFRRHAAVQRAVVRLRCAGRTIRFLDSEGRRSLRFAGDSSVTLEATTQADDGMELFERRRLVAPSCAELPKAPALEAEAEALARDLDSLAGATALESYVGPVLFEGQAAGEFFNQLLARNLSAPRAPWVEDEAVKERFRAGELAGRLGLRVLSPLLEVSDDPTLRVLGGHALVGGYAFDDEGVPPARVELVKGGILKDLLMSRAPVKERVRSNGHGRAAFPESTTGRPGNLIVRPTRGLPEAALRTELLKAARDFGLEYGLLARRLGDETLLEEGERLAAPTLLYKVYVADGREELVRNAVFTSITLRALRDVSAASEAISVYNYYQIGPYRDARGEIPVSLAHPSVLVSEMELKKSEKKPEKTPYLDHPYFEHGRD